MSRLVTDLKPEVMELCVKLLRGALELGYPLIITHTFRSFEEQENLYAKGRIRPGEPCQHRDGVRKPGSCPVHPLGATVTKARAGDSWHNYRMAFDVCFLKDHGAISWEGPWEEIGELGEDLGLMWGGRWAAPDKPHFEYHPNLMLAEMKKRSYIPKIEA